MYCCIAWMYLITHLISGNKTVKDIKTVSNFYAHVTLNNGGCKITMYFKNLIISNLYLLFVRNCAEIIKKDSIDTKPLLKRLFHNSKIANKLFAKTWWLYDNISCFCSQNTLQTFLPKACFCELSCTKITNTALVYYT